MAALSGHAGKALRLRPRNQADILHAKRLVVSNLYIAVELIVTRKGGSAMNKLATIVFTAALSASSLNLAKADQPGPDWMPAEQVKQKVLQSGYTEVTKLEADDGQWEGEGVKNGQKMDFHADSKTGAITHEEPDD